MMVEKGRFEMSAVFAAKYEGICGECGFSFEQKEMVHYVNDKVCHENCHAPDGSDFSPEYDEYSDREPIQRTYLKKGTRKDPPKCPSCNTIHAGECW